MPTECSRDEELRRLGRNYWAKVGAFNYLSVLAEFTNDLLDRGYASTAYDAEILAKRYMPYIYQTPDSINNF